jgi:hypothetical protein
MDYCGAGFSNLPVLGEDIDKTEPQVMDKPAILAENGMDMVLKQSQHSQWSFIWR